MSIPGNKVGLEFAYKESHHKDRLLHVCMTHFQICGEMKWHSYIGKPAMVPLWTTHWKNYIDHFLGILLNTGVLVRAIRSKNTIT